MCSENQEVLPPNSAAVGCIDGRTKDTFRIAATQFCGRRAMVNKFWCREVAHKWFQTKYELPHARVFSEPKCQQRVEPWYLFYRWLIFLLWLSIVFCSIFEVGSYEPKGGQFKWPIYLTNWDLTLGTTQALLGAILVSRRWKSQKKPGFDASSLALGKVEKIYWVLYIVTSSLAVGVTISYWGMVHDPKIHNVDPLNIMLHICNSVLMILDLCIVGIPFEIRCFWWCMVLVMFYLVFSVIYYAAGGLDKFNNHYVYRMLDWKRPGKTLIICTGGLIFVVIVHCLLYLSARFRDHLYAKTRRSKMNYCVNRTEKEPVSIKASEIIV